MNIRILSTAKPPKLFHLTFDSSKVNDFAGEKGQQGKVGPIGLVGSIGGEGKPGING